jgi:hypothetical protein
MQKVRIITNIDPKLGETTFNCNPNLTHYVIPVHDPLWFQFRTVGALEYEGGFGASEVYKTLQTEPEQYEPVLPQLLEQKAGIAPVKRRMTAPMLAGILHEGTILKIWQYYDGTHDGHLTNYMENDKKREFGVVGAYIVNKNYPWLFVSLDAYIKRGYHALDGLVLDEDCPLECKTIGFQAARSYDGGIPKSYIYQVQTQMLVTETDYCEMAILENGSQFKVLYFHANQVIQEQILEATYKNWMLVKQMRTLKEERDSYRLAGKHENAQNIDHHIQNLLPLPGAGEAYADYYTDKHNPQEGTYIRGTVDHYNAIKNRQLYTELSKLWEQQAETIDNQFRDIFVKNQVNIIDFDKLGKLKFTKRTNGKNYFPDYSSIKEKVNKSKAQIIFKDQMGML